MARPSHLQRCRVTVGIPPGRIALGQLKGSVMTTTTFAVEGLTCGSCLAAVLEQLRALGGVTGAAVDLVVGGRSPVVVTSGAVISAEQVNGAVERAGFVLAAPDQQALSSPHDAPVHLLAAQLTRLGNDEIPSGGVRR